MRLTTNGRFSEPVWRTGLALLLLIIGLLLNNGRLHSVDESAMFVAAHNLLNDGVPHTNQIGYSLWGIRPGEAVTMLSASGYIFTKKSPLMVAALTPFIGLGQALPAFSTVQTALWLGAVLLSATAVLLYSTARHLGYTRGAATLAALIFALATMALPYSQTLFGEQVAAFGLLLALAAHRRSPFVVGLGLAMAVGVNSAYALIVPIFAVALWFSTAKKHKLLPFFVPIALLGAGLLFYNHLRFGDWLETGYHFAVGQEGFSTPLWWGMAGLLISPARGLFWYSPPLLLALWGLPRFFRRQRPLTILMSAVILTQLVIFSLWWEWWGGYGWGPRLLLPIVPYLMLWTLPVLQTAVAGKTNLDTDSADCTDKENKNQRSSVQSVSKARWVIGLLMLLGMAVQMAGTAVDVNIYEQHLDATRPAPADQPLRYHHDPALVYAIAQSPIIAHWQAILRGEGQMDEETAVFFEIPAAIQANWQAGDALITLEPSLLYPLLDTANLPPAYGLPYRIEAGDTMAYTLLDRAARDADRLWLITQYPPADPQNWVERALRQEWGSVSDQWADGIRLLLFARGDDGGLSPSAAVFDEMALVQTAVNQTNNTVFVTLQWQAQAPLTEDFVSFVHLLDGDGNLLGQQDRQPLGGYAPTSGWAIGETVTDRFAFPLADGQTATAVRIGWYRWPSLERLPLSGNNDVDMLELPVE